MQLTDGTVYYPEEWWGLPLIPDNQALDMKKAVGERYQHPTSRRWIEDGLQFPVHTYSDGDSESQQDLVKAVRWSTDDAPQVPSQVMNADNILAEGTPVDFSIERVPLKGVKMDNSLKGKILLCVFVISSFTL